MPAKIADPYRNLAAAIINMAIHDSLLLNGRKECKAFFASEWFEFIADFLGLDPDCLRQRIGKIKKSSQLRINPFG